MRGNYLHRTGAGRKRVPFAPFYISWTLFCFLFCILPVVGNAWAAGEGVGKVSAVEGNADVLRGGALPAVPLKAGDSVSVGDVVRTKSDARVEIVFEDGTVLRVAPRSRIDISEYEPGSRGTIRLPRGKIQAVVNKDLAKKAGLKEPNRFEVHTPNAVAGVRGTDFFVYHSRNVTGVLVREGTVYTFNPEVPKVVVNVPAGTGTTVAPRRAPHPPRAVAEGDIKRFERDVTPRDKGKEKTEGGETEEKGRDLAKAEDKPVEQGKTEERSREKAGEKGKSAGEQGRADGRPIGQEPPSSEAPEVVEASSAGAAAEKSTPVEIVAKTDSTGGTGGSTTSLITGSGTAQGTSSDTGFLAPASLITTPEPNILTTSNTLTGLTGNDSASSLTNDIGNTNYSRPITENEQVQQEPLQITISGGPGLNAVTNQSSASFSFTSNKDDAQYTYTLDGAAPMTVSTDLVLTGLPEGEHTLIVTATSGSSTSEQKKYEWTTDYTAPVVTLAGMPFPVTNTNTANFSVTNPEQGVTYTYTLDGQPSSGSLSGLDEGEHTLVVTATDLAGNVTTQPYTWKVDTIVPELSWSEAPKTVTNSRSADFPMKSSETGLTYSYTLDGVKVDSTGLSNLSEGSHTIVVTATDEAGNTSAPVSHAWTTDYTVPVVTLAGKPSPVTNASTASFSATSNEQGVTYTYTLDGQPVSSGSLSNLTEGSHTIIVMATDEAGNPSEPVSYTWVTDYTPPVMTTKTAGASPTGVTTTTVSISMSGSEAVTYSYSLSGPVSSSGTSTSGNITLTGLTAGTYTLNYSLTDSVGNSTSDSDTFTLNRYTLTGSASGSGFTGSVSSGNVSGILDKNWGEWSLVLSGSGSLSPSGIVTAGGSMSGGGYWIDSLFSSGSSDFIYLTPFVLGSGMGSVSVSGSGPYTFTDSGTGLAETSLVFFSEIAGGLMFRDRYSTDPYLTNYNAPTPEGTIDAYLGGTASLWSGSSTPFVMIGTYVPSADPNYSTMNYHWGWEIPVASFNYTYDYETTYDSGAYYGYASGITSGDETQGVLYALYVDPTGKAGILKGSFGQGGDAGDLYEGAGVWYAEGSLERVQILGSTSFADPSTITWVVTDPASDGPSANIFTVTGPVVKDWTGIDDSSGGFFDPVLDKGGEFYNTGSIMKLSYLQDTSSTKYDTFGIWQMESFGSFLTSLAGMNSRWMLSSESSWDVAPLVPDSKPDYLAMTRIYGDGVTHLWRDDATRGKAIGVVADWSAGKTMLLAGEALGTYNTYNSGPVSIEQNRLTGGNDDGVCDGGEKCVTADADYGILTTGAWIETSAFLADPSAYASLGFATTNAGSVPGLTGGWLNGGDSLYAYMDGTNSSSPITLFSDDSGNLRIWANGSVKGTYTGTVDDTWGTWISNNTSPSSATLFGLLEITRWEGGTWMGELELMGGIDGVFQGLLEGAAAGSNGAWTFDGTAAGVADKMNAVSKINTNIVKSWDGTLTSGDGGFLYGALGMNDPWAGGEMSLLGYHTLVNNGVSHIWYQEVEPYNYLDPSYRKTTSEDSTNTLHGSYFGYLGGSQGAAAEGGDGTMDGMLYALFIDSSGNAGILKGSSLSAMESAEISDEGQWELEFPVVSSVLNSAPGITATQLYDAGNIVTTASTPVWQSDSGKFDTAGQITVVTGVNDTLRFTADSSTYTAIISPGTYTYIGLATAVADAMDAADPNPANLYTVSFNGSSDRFEITANTSVDYLWGDAATTAEQILGFPPTDYMGWAASSSMVSAYTVGNIFLDSDYSRYKSASLNGENWGIWQADLYGTYAGPTSFTWSLPFGMKNAGVSLMELEIAGNWDSGAKTLRGNITGYGADISGTPRTFISIGETVGTFDPAAYTWQALGMGMYIDTNKFLSMADTNPDALKRLQIPAFEVGRANLAGTGSWAAGSETLTVNMNNVVFFSSASGGTPSIWASNDFTGSSYTGASSFSGRAVTLTGNGVTVDFLVDTWSGGKWMATVGNSSGSPGPYTFSCASCPLNMATIDQIRGVAAGEYGGGALMGSSAAGVVKMPSGD